MPTSVATYCRLCPASCGLIVEVDDGEVVKVRGDQANALTSGFTCVKGRHLGDFHRHPARLRRSLRPRPIGRAGPDRRPHGDRRDRRSSRRHHRHPRSRRGGGLPRDPGCDGLADHPVHARVLEDDRFAQQVRTDEHRPGGEVGRRRSPRAVGRRWTAVRRCRRLDPGRHQSIGQHARRVHRLPDPRRDAAARRAPARRAATGRRRSPPDRAGCPGDAASAVDPGNRCGAVRRAAAASC